jgi:hypothetical protein
MVAGEKILCEVSYLMAICDFLLLRKPESFETKCMKLQNQKEKNHLSLDLIIRRNDKL